MKNIFNIDVGSKAGKSITAMQKISDTVVYGQADVSGIIRYLLLGIFIFGTIGIVYYILLEKKKRRDMQRSEDKFWKNIK